MPAKPEALGPPIAGPRRCPSPRHPWRCSSLLALAITSACTLAGASSSELEVDRERPCDPHTGTCGLAKSAPLVATRDGQIIENLRIEATNQPGIRVQDVSDVVIRNVEILHAGADGISCENSPGLLIENVSIIHSGARVHSAEENNIRCYRADGLTIKNARLRGGSAGVYVLESPNAHLRYIEGYDFAGPDPRGQLVQFDKSAHCVLEDFSAINAADASQSADNVSVYYSPDCTVRRGFLDGNNGPWSVGVMFEHSEDGLVEEVDTIAMGNGSFAAYPGVDITFRRTRARDNICTDQGRGLPVSDAIVWAGSPDSSGLRIEQSSYFNLCNPDNRVWDSSSFDLIEIGADDFRPRAAIKLAFPWEGHDPAAAAR